jgi:drug/metabolite transporter (DMT)-like permease
LLDGRRLNIRFLVAVALVLLGGALASGVMPGRLSIGSGFALGLLASGIFAWGSQATVKSFPELSPLSRTSITTSGMFGFTAIAWVAALLVGHSWVVVGSLNLTDMGLLVVYGCLLLGVSQVFWIRAVSDVGIGIASFHLNATPFYVMIIVFLLGSDWDWVQTGGVVILTIGAVLAQFSEQLPRRSVLGTVTKI